MRNLFASFFLIISFLFANNAGATESVIHCKVNGQHSSGVFCYQLKSGNAVSLGFKWPDANGECTFSLDIQKGEIFFIRKAGPHNSMFAHIIYLKPGDKKNIELIVGKSSLDYDSSKIDQPNAETVYLQNWLTKSNQIITSASKMGNDRSAFYNTYNQFVLEAEQLKKNAKSNNPHFNRLFTNIINTDLLFIKAAAFFYNNDRLVAKYDSSKAVESFYKPLIQGAKLFCSTTILDSWHGEDLMKYTFAYKRFCVVKSMDAMKASVTNLKFTDDVPFICNDTLKGVYVASYISWIKSYEQFSSKIEPYHQYFYSEDLKNNYKAKEKEVATFGKGDVAYNFSLKNIQDKTYSLSDFKGKVVVLDVWAMWCAPCLAEKPYFLALEEEFANRNDIVFVGISVDGEVKKEVWKSFVQKKGWKGIELLANPDESIMKYYKIGGIPRFMVFDKAGKIVTVDAPRPSDPALKKIIESTLTTPEKI